MNRLDRIGWAAAIALAAAAAYAQDSPPQAPALGRAVAMPPPATQRQVSTPAGNPTTDEPKLTTNARAQADAEHQAARAKCEAHPKGEQATCLREADERYDRALAGETPGEQGNPGSNVGAKATGNS